MKAWSKTHVGLIRENNEDALLVAEPKLFAVADGMGGSNAGEVASKNALHVFRASLERQLDQDQPITYALRCAVSEANKHIYLLSMDSEDYKGMGTTLTALYFENPFTAHVVQVGDSRLYRWRNGKLTQITTDQTMVGALVAAGRITKEEATQHPRKNWLLQAIGVDEVVQAEISRVEIQPGDRYLLCSDGLSNMLTEQELARGLQTENLAQVSEVLLEKALSNGGKDNISMIVLGDFDKEDAHGANN